jgi:hypothetical protein
MRNGRRTRHVLDLRRDPLVHRDSLSDGVPIIGAGGAVWDGPGRDIVVEPIEVIVSMMNRVKFPTRKIVRSDRS